MGDKWDDEFARGSAEYDGLGVLGTRDHLDGWQQHRNDLDGTVRESFDAVVRIDLVVHDLDVRASRRQDQRLTKLLLKSDGSQALRASQSQDRVSRALVASYLPCY